MANQQDSNKKPDSIDHYRRAFLKRLGITTAATVGATSAHGAWGGKTLGDTFADFFQQHYQRMTPEELQETLDRSRSARATVTVSRPVQRKTTWGRTFATSMSWKWMKAV